MVNAGFLLCFWTDLELYKKLGHFIRCQHKNDASEESKGRRMIYVFIFCRRNNYSAIFGIKEMYAQGKENHRKITFWIRHYYWRVL